MPKPTGKRVDYKKIDKDRAAIVKDMERRTNVPQRERMFPSLPEKARRVTTGMAKAFGQANKNQAEDRRERKLERALGRSVKNVPYRGPAPKKRKPVPV